MSEINNETVVVVTKKGKKFKKKRLKRLEDIYKEEDEGTQPRKKAARKGLHQPSINQITTLDSLLRFVKVKPDSWDILIVGDGSGTTWGQEIGWGSVMIERNTFERMEFFGGMNRGTNNIAEILAVLHPLMYLSNTKQSIKQGGLQVHVLSDSEYVVQGLRNTSPAWASQLKHNRELWLAIHGTQRKGIVITSHHIPRDKIALNKLSHDLANLARKAHIGLIDDLNWDINQANPG